VRGEAERWRGGEVERWREEEASDDLWARRLFKSSCRNAPSNEMPADQNVARTRGSSKSVKIPPHHQTDPKFPMQKQETIEKPWDWALAS
jgi:hypothetical protein